MGLVKNFKSYKEPTGGVSFGDLDTGHYDDGHAFGWKVNTKAEEQKALESTVNEFLDGTEPELFVPMIEPDLGVDLNGDGVVGSPADRGPVILSFTVETPGGCNTCTRYTALASDAEDGGNLIYAWFKEPPPMGDPGQTDCGYYYFTSEMQPRTQAIWDHPNAPKTGVPTPCPHGKSAIEHPGYITVIVTDSDGEQDECTYPYGTKPTTTSNPETNCLSE